MNAFFDLLTLNFECYIAVVVAVSLLIHIGD